jgi:hypothetical protein
MRGPVSAAVLLALLAPPAIAQTAKERPAPSPQWQEQLPGMLHSLPRGVVEIALKPATECPMPVARGRMADSMPVSSQKAAPPSVPAKKPVAMPTARATCRNPL